MSEVRFRKSAQADVQQAFEYLEGQSRGLGAEFLERVEEATAKISTNPEQYQTVFRDVRRAPVARFKHSLWYRILPDHSVVVACLSDKRDPSLARRRSFEVLEP